LARLCLAQTHADEAIAQVQATGLLVKASHTKLPVQSPWVAIMNQQTEIARKLAVELALPPAQRSRAGLAPPRDPVRADDGWSF
jgi:phage terminase small subunit